MTNRHWLSGLAATLIGCGASAQVVIPPSADPGALQQRRLEEEQRRLDDERLQRKPAPGAVLQAPARAAAAALPAGRVIALKQLKIQPASELLPNERLRAWAAELEGREVRLGDVQALVDRINAAYRERGVVTAQALIPPQDITEGVIEIRLVEGRVGAVSVSGNAATREAYVLGRVDAAPGRLVDLPALEASLNQFNRVNDVQLRSELKAGKAFGSTDLLIQVQEPATHAFRATLDNFGSEVTGQTRVGLGYSHRSLLGWRDELGLGLLWADGLKSYSLDYSVPLNRLGGRVKLSRSQDKTELKHGELASLAITGESTSTSLGLRQPVHLGPRSELDLLAGLRQREVGNQISGVFLSSTKIDDAHLGLEYQASDDSGSWLASYSYFSGRADSGAGDQTYQLGRVTLRRTQALAEGWSLRGLFSLQHTSTEQLPSSEQFFIGGEGSVRGYGSGTFAGESGQFLGLELHHPLVAGGADAGVAATGFFFAETGQVKPFLPPNSLQPARERLSSLGWGVEAALGRQLNARLTLAYGTRKLETEKRRYSVGVELSSGF